MALRAGFLLENVAIALMMKIWTHFQFSETHWLVAPLHSPHGSFRSATREFYFRILSTRFHLNTRSKSSIFQLQTKKYPNPRFFRVIVMALRGIFAGKRRDCTRDENMNSFSVFWDTFTRSSTPSPYGSFRSATRQKTENSFTFSSLVQSRLIFQQKCPFNRGFSHQM